jgi:hypothetical protein
MIKGFPSTINWVVVPFLVREGKADWLLVKKEESVATKTRRDVWSVFIIDAYFTRIDIGKGTILLFKPI